MISVVAEGDRREPVVDSRKGRSATLLYSTGLTIGMVRAVIFDLYDVLVDTQQAFKDAHNVLYAYLREKGLAVARPLYDEAFKRAMSTIQIKHARTPQAYDWGLVIDELGKQFRLMKGNERMFEATDLFERTFMDGVELYSDAKEFLKFCKLNKIKAGLVADGISRRERRIIEKFFLDQLFEVILISDEVQSEKSSGVAYEAAARKLVILPDQILSVTTKLQDIPAANKLGMKTALLSRKAEMPRPGRSEEKPKYFAKSLTELQSSVSM